MTPTRWKRVQEVVNTALDLPASERASFIDEVCGSNADLRSQIEDLVDSYENAGSFFEDAIEAGAHYAIAGDTAAAGDRIGAYELAESIGQGGMGTVYRAVRADDQFRQQVAIKIIRSGIGAAPELLTRFRAERQILASMAHPHIARLLDGGVTASGLPYLVMEFIEGTTIDDFVQAQRLGIRDRLELFRKVCSATQYAHQNLIVHRDIKPANVLVTVEGEPKLLDFGIAKLLQPGSFGQTVVHTSAADRLMTPGYASPEQIRGEAITTATDVYALGVLLYQLLTGKPAFETQNLTPAQVERLICETGPPRPSTLTRRQSEGGQILGVERIPADLDNIVMKAMHKDPLRRYVSAAELSDDVRRYLQGFPVTARADSWSYRTSRFLSRHKLGVSVAMLVLLTIAGLGVGLVQQTVNARRETKTAEGVASFLTSLFRSSRPDVTQGRSFSARDILDRGAARIPAELQGEPEMQARLLLTIGQVYYSLGAFDRAESLAKQAIDLTRRLHGKDSLIEAQSNAFILAQVALAHGKFDEAARYVDHALPILKKHQSPALPNLFVISGLANWHRGDLDTAESRLREAILLNTEQKGAEHKDTLGSKGNLGLVFLDTEQYAAADTLQREVLAVRMRTLGVHHPDVAINTANVGDVEKATEQWPQAEKTYRLTMERYRDVFGTNHPRFTTPLNILAEIETNQGRYEEALGLNSQALELSERVIGPRTVTTGQILLTRAWILIKQGQLKEARQLLTQSLSILDKLYTAGDAHTAEAHEVRGELELAENDFGAAQRDFTEGLESRLKIYGHKGLHVASSLVHQGDVLRAQGKYQAAEAKYVDGIQTARIKWTGPSTTVAHALFGQGTALLAEGKPREARAQLQESLDIQRKSLPSDHPDLAASASALAQCEALLHSQSFSSGYQ